MHWQYDPEIKLNKLGNPDIDFYLSEAKRLRSEAVAAMIRDILGRLKKTVLGHPVRTVH